MAKPKTKRCVMDTEATEVEGRPGVWEFTVGLRVWQWEGGTIGLNTAVARLDDPAREWTDLVYCKTLDFAVMFAWGFHSGTQATDK